MICLAVLAMGSTQAQETIEIVPVTGKMSKGENAGFEFMIWQATEELVSKDWEKAIRGESKSKPEEKGDELVIVGTLLPSITADSLNVYSQMIPSKEGLKMTVWVEHADGYVTKDNEQLYLPLEKFLHEFAATKYREAVEKEIELEEDVLKDLEKEQDKLGKEHDKLLADISKNEVRIQETKNKIGTNESDQENQRGLIQAQKKKVQKTKNEEAKDAEEKVLKDLEKDLKKLVKEHEGYHKDVVKMQSEIREAERDVSDNELARNLKQEEIEKQKVKLQGIQAKLSNIE